MKIRNFNLGVWGFGDRSRASGGLGVWGFGGLVRASPDLAEVRLR